VQLEGNQHLTSQRAERELGVTFRPLDQTIGDEASWYRSHGMLPARRAEPSGSERTRTGAGPRP
jgi:dihydroflavonol-4-reductase